MPTFKGMVRDRGKAEADSATDGEGAECEETTVARSRNVEGECIAECIGRGGVGKAVRTGKGGGQTRPG